MNKVLKMINIKRFIPLATVLSVFTIAIISCAKEPKAGTNDSSKRYFDAWVATHSTSSWERTDMGEYIVSDKVGSGEALGDASSVPYVFVSYTVTDLDGNISSSTDEKTQKQLGSYSKANYYGPVVWVRDDSYMQAGVEYAIEGMKIGGERKVVIPGWLMTYNRYDKESDYINNVSGTDCIYDIKILGRTADILKWQIDSLERYTAKYMDNVDSTVYGYYYQQLKAPTDTSSFDSDTTIYINYVGRLLNGQVFDTNIADTAKLYGLYSSSTTYSPTQINWGSAYTDLTMTSSESTMITGFAKAIFGMKAMEKGRCVFYSPYGYGESGSGAKIPAFAMLRFDIELVKNPNDD
jgi:FKBP-type peptidyl-prolyl cis-trans isomerase